MNNNLPAYADIMNEVFLDTTRPIENRGIVRGLSMVTGYFKGHDTEVTLYVIQSSGVLNLAVDFTDGHYGYDVNLFTWTANEEKVRRIAENAHASIMEQNNWKVAVA